jgi:hypothetical protein
MSCDRRRSTNSFRRKLFGQAFEEEVEDMVDVRSVHQVRIHPLSVFRFYWDLVIVVVVIYAVIMLPLRAAFYWDYYRDLGHHHNLFEQIRVTHTPCAASPAFLLTVLWTCGTCTLLDGLRV